jgi:60 kDa SS-A/Ro ribonucleoprotein
MSFKSRKIAPKVEAYRKMYGAAVSNLLGSAKNEAGGDVYKVDMWTQLERFLILGSSDGGYHTIPQELTQQNLERINDCLQADGMRVLRTVETISAERRAARHEPALLVLAALFCHDDVSARQAAAVALPRIARIGTHLFTFADFVCGMRSWGRVLRTAVANWYVDKDIDQLVYQLIKYQQRNGWSHRDLLRLTHPNPKNAAQNAAFFWAVEGDKIGQLTPEWQEAMPAKIYAVEALKKCSPSTSNLAAALIRTNQLPREVVPTQLLNNANVWHALLRNMIDQGLDEAILRNLGRVSSLGIFEDSYSVERVSEYLRQKCRAHPIKILTALHQYQIGHGNFMNKNGEYRSSWTPNPIILEALEAAFYSSFQFIKPSNKRIMLAIDVSGSMRRSTVAGLENMTTVQAAACLAMIFLRSEPNVTIVGYNGSGRYLEVNPEWNLEQFSQYIFNQSNGSTNCSAPMQMIVRDKLQIDAIINITDTQHWDGPPCGPELMKARQVAGIPIKHAVVAMCPTRWTLSNPNDALSMDCVGYDPQVPRLIQQFIGSGFEENEE